MPYTIVVESTDAVPENQIALMSYTLNVLRVDPAVQSAQWYQHTSTTYGCMLGTSNNGQHLAVMTDKLPSSPPPAYSPHRGSFKPMKSVTAKTSPSASDPTTRHQDLVSGPPPISTADGGRTRIVTVLGPWSFPKGKGGECRRWKELRKEFRNDRPWGPALVPVLVWSLRPGAIAVSWSRQT
ncbi:hypothetical protein L873DRAFT_1786145 [Choiromyces venosus 120613-1]|uniref:Uncharacterized protein n=1 Tax=Choiromyces venosus 120613-1 TaxID=1336337 RepID=A0A3N4K623_9PEZI|nr:hypothetical protein L873DRAFT_1786145 [Choiromyces venosus 120613-1]